MCGVVTHYLLEVKQVIRVQAHQQLHLQSQVFMELIHTVTPVGGGITEIAIDN